MIKIFESLFEIVRPIVPFLLFFSLFGFIGSFLKIIIVSDSDYRYSFKPYSRIKNRRRRKAYWLLLKYKISSRRKCKHDKRKSSDFAEGSYLWNFTYKK